MPSMVVGEAPIIYNRYDKSLFKFAVAGGSLQGAAYRNDE